MEVRFATRPAPGRLNEDAVVVGDGFAVVLDGATPEPDTDSGCVHDVRWYVTQLISHLTNLLLVADATLSGLLRAAIERVCDSHADTCDLGNPCSPSATVTIVRELGERVEYLVLGDSPVIVERSDGELVPVVDDRLSRFTGTWAELRMVRNVPGGVWVAGSVPAAAEHAVVGAVSIASTGRVALLTDGAARLVERYDWTWPDLIDLLDAGGPAALIATTRRAERTTPPGWFGGKHHDDATAVLCRFPGSHADVVPR